jgi:PKD repeat protein
MKKTPCLPLALAAVLFNSELKAQQVPHFECLANDPVMLAEMHGNDPVALQRIALDEAELEAWTQEFVANYSPAARNTYIIPVVFHIIHDNGAENISDAQVEDAIRILNNDFNKLNTDWPSVKEEFLDLVADVGVEFRLARKDPQGNCTNGITRTKSATTYLGDQQMTSLIQWPRNRYMNIWVGASAGGANVAGYTNYPSSVNGTPSRDGIVMRHNYVGSIGTGSSSGSRTLTHEVGHWINLPHLWGNSNTPAVQSNCNTDDGVADTPNTIGWQSCNRNGVTCGTLDNVENYMEYAFCSKMFTNGQAARMLAALNSTVAQRNQLWQASNIAFTGVDLPGVLCQARFNSSSQSVCAGATVNYSDQSFHNVVSREWSFPGGTPATSTEQNPSVEYSSAGVYPVSLTVSDGTSSLTNTSTAYITVLDDPGMAVPVEDGFETYTTLDGSPWTVLNQDGDNTFALTNVAAFTGDNSARLLNTSSMTGRLDELVSNTYDMSGVSGIRIAYRYAYARRTSSNDDRLRFYVSNNCGQTWSLRQQLRGSTNLNTGGVVTASFVPTDSQWGYAEVTNVSASYHTSDFRFKFEFESNGGNNVYIDDININGSTVGLDDIISSQGTALSVVPNPARGHAEAVFNLSTSSPVRLELIDVLGRQLSIVHEGIMTAGSQRIALPVNDLGPGLYFVRMTQGTDSRVVRFQVE